MALLPFVQELWLWVVVIFVGWLAAPVLLVWKRRYVTGLVLNLFWMIVFGLVAYVAFEISAKAHHPNRYVPVISSFLFLMSASAVLVSTTFAAIMAISAKRQRAAPQIQVESHS